MNNQKDIRGELTELQLPTKRPRLTSQPYQRGVYNFKLKSILTEQLKMLSVQEDTTLFDTLLALYQTLLYRYSGQVDILIGTPILETNKEYWHSIKYYGADLSEHLSFRDLLKRVRIIDIKTIYPQGSLQDSLNQDLGNTATIHTMFNLQQRELEENTPSTFITERRNKNFSQLDITLEVIEHSDGLLAIFEYNKELFETETIIGLANHFQVLIEIVVTKPDTKISMIPILTETEKQKVLKD